MTAEKMMDCPFCGNVPTLRHIGGSRPFVLMSCKTDNCPATPKVTGDTEAEVIEGWNTRASAVGAGAREALKPAGKQARFKKDISPWFAVFNWHNDPENFEYRTVYALPSDPVRRTTQQEEDIVWRKINDEPFEYAIQQNPLYGDAFVRLLNGKCLRRKTK